jgi:cyclic pyranopterin phosphate synthase
MTPDEIEEIVSVAAELGIDKIKITGGEPLIRDDVEEIVRRIVHIIPDVSMTTNGAFLPTKACRLKAAGLQRVNISFHSLDPGLFKKLTGCGDKDVVERGIISAIECGLNPVKLNMVVMRGSNSSEIWDMVDFTRRVGAILQLIEYQALERGVEGWDQRYYDLHPIEEELERHSEKVVERELHRRRLYKLVGGGSVEVVRPMHNSQFCAYCSRLRLTSDGYLKPCLMRDDNLIHAVDLIRDRAPRNQLIDAFRKAVSLRAPYWRD